MERRYRSIRSLRSIDVLNSTRKIEESFLDITSEKIRELCSPFQLVTSQWERVMNIFNVEIEKGLDSDGGSKELKMLNTFVKEITTKRIVGEYLSIDFKGRYYRVMRVVMAKDVDKIDVDETLYTIPKKVRTQPGLEVFKYVAQTLNDFLMVRGLQNHQFDLAFCFNFPVELVSLSEAILISWTKEFSCDAVVGKDVCALLQEAIDELELKVKIKAVFNDTVGVLAACAAKDPECGIGIIVSAGTNCCYYEKASRIKRDFAKFAVGQEIIINTEWGAFGEGGCMKDYLTEYDEMIDHNSLHPGTQIFEKMISTLYIAELARLLIVEATSRNLLFNGVLPEKLTFPQSFTSQFLFDIDRDPPNVYLSAEVVLRERFKIASLSRGDLVGIRYICRTVITRSANLLGAACACLINRMGRRRTTIAVDGAFFRFSSTFPALLVETITQLIPYSFTFKLKLVDDGTGKGAATIIAALQQVAPTKARIIFYE